MIFLAVQFPSIRLWKRFMLLRITWLRWMFELLYMLKDSFIFLGNDNVGMVKVRRDNVKSVLPKHVQGLCSDSVEYSSVNLFGDSLKTSIKEVSALNKLNFVAFERGFSWKAF